jgi:inner membrane protein
MTGRTHAAIGLSEALAISLIDNNIQPAFLCGILVGCMLPDIDSAGSFISRKLKVNLGFLGHRKILHSILGSLIFSLPFVIFQKYFGPYSLFIAYGLFIGCITHLILDSFTVSGIAWFYPFSKKKIKGKIVTGSIWDTVFLVCGVASIFILAKYISNGNLNSIIERFIK